MTKGPLFPPGWLKETLSDPTLAAKALEEQATTIKRLSAENKSVRDQKDALRQDVKEHDEIVRKYQAILSSERTAARHSKEKRMEVEKELESRRLALADEEARNRELEKHVKGLKRALDDCRDDRAASRVLVSAIENISAIPDAKKRIAAAFHPDQMPVEVRFWTTQVFEFVQGVKDAN